MFVLYDGNVWCLYELYMPVNLITGVFIKERLYYSPHSTVTDTKNIEYNDISGSELMWLIHVS